MPLQSIVLEPEEIETTFDRFGVSPRDGAYVIAVKNGIVKAGERLSDTYDMTTSLVALTNSYPDCDVFLAEYITDTFTQRPTNWNFTAIYNSSNTEL